MKFSKPVVISMSAMLNFTEPQHGIRYEQKRAESAFADLMRVQSIQTNIQDSEDPNAARLVFINGAVNLNLSKLRVQIDVSMNRKDDIFVEVDRFFGFIRPLWERALNVFDDIKFSSYRVVVSIATPVDASYAELNQHIGKEYLHEKFQSNLVKGGATVLWREGNYVIGTDASVYEDYRLPEGFSSKPGAVATNDDYVLQSRGILIKLTVSMVEGVPQEALNYEKIDLTQLALKDFLKSKFQAITGIPL